jgi:hypothetical protein
MKKLTPNDPEMHSADLLAENVEQLKAFFRPCRRSTILW